MTSAQQPQDMNLVLQDIKSLPRLGTENAKYVKQRSRPCLWAGLGGYLKSEIDMSSFTHVIVLNSALRGPFLPVYSQVRLIRLSLL